MTRDPRYAQMRVVVQTVAVFLLVCLGAAGVASLPGCAALQPQKDLAALCVRLTDRNAGVTCVKAGHAAVRDGATTVLRRYEEGQISLTAARQALAGLEQVYDTVELAEIAVLAGDLRSAETQLDVAIGLLNTLEASQ